MPRIFISYRRDDTAGYADRLYTTLAHEFGDANVFMDRRTIQPGIDFGTHVQESVGTCDVVLIVIGRRWVTIWAEREPDTDWVRLEVEAALQRTREGVDEHGFRAIPVLVHSAPMPGATDLPPVVADIARLQAIELSEQSWRHDLKQLIDLLWQISPSAEKPRRWGLTFGVKTKKAGGRSRLVFWISVMSAVLVVALVTPQLYRNLKSAFPVDSRDPQARTALRLRLPVAVVLDDGRVLPAGDCAVSLGGTRDGQTVRRRFDFLKDGRTVGSASVNSTDYTPSLNPMMPSAWAEVDDLTDPGVVSVRLRQGGQTFTVVLRAESPKSP